MQSSFEQCLLVLKLFMSLHKHRLVLEKKEVMQTKEKSII